MNGDWPVEVLTIYLDPEHIRLTGGLILIALVSLVGLVVDSIASVNSKKRKK